MLRICWAALPRYRQSPRLLPLHQRLCKASSRSWHPVAQTIYRQGSFLPGRPLSGKPFPDEDRETVIRFIDQLQQSQLLASRLPATNLNEGFENGTVEPTARSLGDRSTIGPRIYSMLKDDNVSPHKVWFKVRRAYSESRPEGRSSIGPREADALHQLLQRFLDYWALGGLKEGLDAPIYRPLAVIQFFVERDCVMNADWAALLSILAPLAYRFSLFPPSNVPSHGLAQKMAAAAHLGTLIRAWSSFVTGEIDQGSGKAIKAEQSQWSASPDSENTEESYLGSDFIGNFMASTSRLSQVEDTQLRRKLDCTSVLSLVTLYNSLSTFHLHKAGSARNQEKDFSDTAGLESDLSIQPNWHLELKAGQVWIPDVGTLSSGEASLMYAGARAAVESPPNMTLFRITLSQIGLSEDELNDILQTYRKFQLAAPRILDKFSGLETDPVAHENGLRRRWPLYGILEDAVDGGDLETLESCSIEAEVLRQVGKLHHLDILQLGKAFLRMDDVNQAIRWFELWLSSGDGGPQSWTPWLDYAFVKRDVDICERVWRNLVKHKWRPTTNARNQRLRLLLDHGEYDTAWHFLKVLLRPSNNHDEIQPLVIATPEIDQDVFHTFIEYFLFRAPYSPYASASARADQTLSFMGRQERHQPTRETYMLFIRYHLHVEDRPAAINRFVEGRNSGVTFTAGDFALLFEHDLVSPHSPLSHPFENVLASIRATAKNMAIILGRRPPEAKGQTVRSTAGDTIVTRLGDLEPIDILDDDLADSDTKKMQEMHADLIQHIAVDFQKRPAKLARLRLLLLLWDHCVATGVPPSRPIKSILQSTISTLPASTQAALILGNLFQSQHKSIQYLSSPFRFVRLIGSTCFADLLRLSSGPVRSHISSIPWKDGTNITEHTLAHNGISDPQQRTEIVRRLNYWRKDSAQLRTRLRFEANKKPRKSKSFISLKIGHASGGDWDESRDLGLDVTTPDDSRIESNPDLVPRSSGRAKGGLTDEGHAERYDARRVRKFSELAATR